VEPQTEHLDTVVIYDDEDDQRRTRAKSARVVCEELVAEGFLAAMPKIRAAGLRQEALHAVLEGGRTLLLADLMAHDDSPRGARLLQALSANPDVTERTWRIALTRLADPRVALMLRGHVNAVVVYDDTDLAPIAQALKDVLTQPPLVPEAPRSYPDDVAERYPRKLRTRLFQALRGDFTAADAEAAFRWILPNQSEVVPETDPEREPGFSRTSELQSRIERIAGHLEQPSENGTDTPKEIRALQQKLKNRTGQTDLEPLRAHVHKCLWAVAPANLRQTVTPEAVTFMMRGDNREDAEDWEESKDETWLTEAEHTAAWTVARRARTKLREQSKPGKKGGSGGARLALNEVFRDEKLKQELSSRGLEMWDAHYAICSIVDWLVDLADEQYRPIGDD
jgi:hypothetical protein